MAVFCLLLVLAGSCKKGGSDTSLVVLNIFPHVGSDSLVFGKTYANPSGRNITFSRIEYYISDINLVRTDNSFQPISGVILAGAQTTQYILGTIPTGDYKSIEFNIGVDASQNHVDTAEQATGGPLGAQFPSMHFATDSLGYIFLALEGLVDTSGSGTGAPSVGYSYHIGTDALFEPVVLPDHSAAPYNAVFTASGGKVLSFNLIADFNVLLKNMDMKAHLRTGTTDYPLVADTLAAHIPGMFTYQQ